MAAEKLARLVCAACVALALAATARSVEARELKRRTVTISETNGAIPALHVAPGIATVIAFQANLRDASFARELEALFHPLTRTARTVVVVPKQVVTKPVSLSVAMSDGTIVTFALVTVGKDVDAQVDVVIALRSAPDSPEALRNQVAELEAKLEDCHAASERAGARKIAALVLAQGGEAPQAFESHVMRGTERQSRLRVEARRVYRMLELTYLVLTVANRDPQRSWVLGRVEVHLTGGGQTMELAVETYKPELEELPPDKEEKVVVAFKTPQVLKANQRIAVALLEKDGSRRVELKDLEL